MNQNFFLEFLFSSFFHEETIIIAKKTKHYHETSKEKQKIRVFLGITLPIYDSGQLSKVSDRVIANSDVPF